MSKKNKIYLIYGSGHFVAKTKRQAVGLMKTILDNNLNNDQDIIITKDFPLESSKIGVNK